MQASSTRRTRSCRSEIRHLRGRDGRSLSAVVTDGVFGANKFRPLTEGAQRAPIGDSCRPRGCKDAIILDSKVELQAIDPIIEVAYEALVGYGKWGIFPFTPCFRDPPGFVVNQSITRACVYGVPNQSIIENGPILIPTVSITSVSPS